MAQGVWGSAFCKLIKWHIRGEKDINLADFTSTSDEKLASFKAGVDELINNRNSRSSAQLEKEIECNSDDDGLSHWFQIGQFELTGLNLHRVSRCP
jgi:hypothetical protein